MSAKTKLDFVSDVSCPWCAIGLQSLLAALSALRGVLEGELHFQPFELNPDMGPGGQDIAEHIAHKYGPSPEQFAHSQEMIRARGAQLGFRFDMQKRTRIYNTFDAQVGLDPTQAQAVLASDRYGAEVRARERFYASQGINGVPAVIINDRHLIEGGQPVAVFERVLRQVAPPLG
jgi:predicted DsbA family dithiol-disulfide isomerase